MTVIKYKAMLTLFLMLSRSKWSRKMLMHNLLISLTIFSSKNIILKLQKNKAKKKKK